MESERWYSPSQGVKERVGILLAKKEGNIETERWYSPGQAVHYNPGAVKWMLKHYFEFLHQGVWPPKGGGGCEVRSGTVYAHELVSGITGELMLRAMVQGYSGMVLFALYAYHNQDDSRVARWAGVSVHAVHVAVGIALRGIKYYVPKPINLETRLAWAGLLAAQDRSFISCPKT